MLSPKIEGRLNRLLAMRDKGVFTDEEFAARLGDLLTTDNIGTLLERCPPDLIGVVKKAIALDNRRAADNECLQPEASPLDWLDIFDRYYRNVAELLLEPGKPRRQGLISVVCLPSFEVEWALRLIGSEEKGYSLALSVAEAQIWPSRGTSPIAVKRRESPLAADLAVAVCEAWRKMLLRVRHPERGTGHLDGVTYHFACHGPGFNWMAGKTWSPEPQTAPGKLVALGHLLYQYVERDEPERSVLANEIRQAADWFRDLA
jgi:hypothetical protein